MPDTVLGAGIPKMNKTRPVPTRTLAESPEVGCQTRSSGRNWETLPLFSVLTCSPWFPSLWGSRGGCLEGRSRITRGSPSESTLPSHLMIQSRVRAKALEGLPQQLTRDPLYRRQSVVRVETSNPQKAHKKAQEVGPN